MKIQCMLPEDAKNITPWYEFNIWYFTPFFIWGCDMSLQTFYPFIDIMHKNA